MVDLQAEIRRGWRRLAIAWLGIAALIAWTAWPRETLRVAGVVVLDEGGTARIDLRAISGEMSSGAVLRLLDRETKTLVSLTTATEGSSELVIEGAGYTRFDTRSLELRDAAGAASVSAGSEYRPDGPAWLELRSAARDTGARLSALAEGPSLSLYAEDHHRSLEISQP